MDPVQYTLLGIIALAHLWHAVGKPLAGRVADFRARRAVRKALVDGAITRQTVIRIAQGDTFLFTQMNDARLEGHLRRFADRKMSLMDVGIRIPG